MEGKRIFVKFGSLQNPSRIKCINLPENTKNEVASLRHLLHQEILADQSIMSLGGNESTPRHDVVLQKFDEDYGELLDLPSSTVFDNVEKNILVKLSQTDQKSTSNEQQSLSANSRSGSRHDACEPSSSKQLKPNVNDNQIPPFSMNLKLPSKKEKATYLAEEEIQILETPLKAPPLCIVLDTDLDDEQMSPSTSTVKSSSTVSEGQEVEQEWREFMKKNKYPPEELSVLRTLSADLHKQAQPFQNRIGVMNRNINKLIAERKPLSDEINKLIVERKPLADEIMSFKQRQLDLLRAAMSKHGFASDSATHPFESTSIVKTPAATKSADKLDVKASTVQPAASSKSQSIHLGKNRVEGDTEVSSNPVLNVSVETDRKRKASEDSNDPKTNCQKKTPTPSSFKPPKKLQTEDSHHQKKEISKGKAQTVSSWPKVVEPTVPEAQKAEFKVTESKTAEPQGVGSKVDQSKDVQSKVVVSKKSATGVNSSKKSQMPTDINSPSLKHCRSYSRQDESNTLSKLNAQAAGELPSDNSAATPYTTTPAVSTDRANSSAPPVSKQPLSSADASRTDPVFLQPHLRAISCVNIFGSCAFAASEDGTVRIYDINTNSFLKQITVSTHPVTWLYGIPSNTSNQVLSTHKSVTEDLNHLTLLTGSKDKQIRQIALNSGSLIHTKLCTFVPTCAEGTNPREKLYFGSKEGVISAYITPKNTIKRVKNFQVNAEVLCMKILPLQGKEVIVVAARQMDPILFDLETEDLLFTWNSNVPKSSFNCISFSAKYVFCFDDNRTVMKFDVNSGILLQSERLASVAVSCFHYGNRFLVIGCTDGLIRVLDFEKDPPLVFALNTQGSKNKLSCMTVFGDKVVGGTPGGAVFNCQLPDLEALINATPQGINV